MKSIKFILLIAFLVSLLNCSKNELNIPDGSYIGQKPPGFEPEFFAPGIVTTRHHEHSSPAFSPDGNEIYWSAFIAPLQSGAPQVILFMKKENNKWSKPQVASFSGQYFEGSPCFSPDGKKLFFNSNRPITGNGDPNDSNLWFVERNELGWGKPVSAGTPVNTEKSDRNPSIARNGNIYFVGFADGYPYNHGIYRAKFKKGKYEQPEFLPETINSKKSYDGCPFIDPDEKFIMFASGRDGGLGSGDLYISYRTDNNTWTEAKNLGPKINSDRNDRFPVISPDGKYLFFLSNRNIIKSFSDRPQTLIQLQQRYNHPGNGLADIYWVDAKLIEKLK